MKSIQEYLTGAINESLKDTELKKLQRIWDKENSGKLPMKMDDLINFVSQALDSANIFASSITDEVKQYDNVDELVTAIDNKHARQVEKFLEEIKHILSSSEYDNSEYPYAIIEPYFLTNLMDYMGKYTDHA